MTRLSSQLQIPIPGTLDVASGPLAVGEAVEGDDDEGVGIETHLLRAGARAWRCSNGGQGTAPPTLDFLSVPDRVIDIHVSKYSMIWVAFKASFSNIGPVYNDAVASIRIRSTTPSVGAWADFDSAGRTYLDMPPNEGILVTDGRELTAVDQGGSDHVVSPLGRSVFGPRSYEVGVFFSKPGGSGGFFLTGRDLLVWTQEFEDVP